jgi:DNA-directed RNA polymerase alpha subunit
MSYFVKILFKKYDEDVPVFEASGIGEEALEIILSNYYGVNYDIKICKEIPSLDESSIKSLDLSTRPSECLRRADITTIPQLIEAYNTGKLLVVRNLGRKSYDEIVKKLLILNLIKEDNNAGN